MWSELRCVKRADQVDVNGSEIWLLGRFIVARIGKNFISSVDTSICDDEGNSAGRGEWGCSCEEMDLVIPAGCVALDEFHTNRVSGDECSLFRVDILNQLFFEFISCINVKVGDYHGRSESEWVGWWSNVIQCFLPCCDECADICLSKSICTYSGKPRLIFDIH
jgi:hypothetical protein